MCDKIDVDHWLNRCPEVTGLLVPDLDNPLIRREEFPFISRRFQMDEILDWEPHAVILLEERTRVSQIKYADLTGACSESERKTIIAVIQGRDFTLVYSQNSDPSFAPGIKEFNRTDGGSECAKTMG